MLFIFLDMNKKQVSLLPKVSPLLPNLTGGRSHFSQKIHPSESPDVSASLSFLVVYIFIQTPLHAPVIANYLNMGTRRKANWTPAELNILVSRVTDNIHIVRASISGPGAAERTKFWADLCERWGFFSQFYFRLCTSLTLIMIAVSAKKTYVDKKACSFIVILL